MTEPVTCPTCGKPLPTGKKTCPECSRVEVPRERHHVSGWVSLAIVVVVIAVLVPVTVVMSKKWAHEKHQGWVEADIAQAQEAAKAGKFSSALFALDQAQKELAWFESEDLMRADLGSQIERERNALRQAVDRKLHEMVQAGDELGAQAFYVNERIEQMDVNGTLREYVRTANENRKIVLGYRTALKQAQKCYQEGQFTEALKEITALRKQVGDPYRAKGEALAEIRTTVEGLHNTWIQEAVAKGMKLLNDGKLGQASAWLEMTKDFLLAGDITTRRKLEEILSAIVDGRVIGLTVQVDAARVVKIEDARAEVVAELNQKLLDQGFLPVILASSNDPRVGEIGRVLEVDYREDKGPMMTSERRERVLGTRVGCTMKLLSANDNKVVWKAPGTVSAQTGTVTGLGVGEFTEANLRRDALRRFFIELDTVRIPSRDFLP